MSTERNRRLPLETSRSLFFVLFANYGTNTEDGKYSSFTLYESTNNTVDPIRQARLSIRQTAGLSTCNSDE